MNDQAEIQPGEPSIASSPANDKTRRYAQSSATRAVHRWPKLSKLPTWESLHAAYRPPQLDALETLLARRPDTYGLLEQLIQLPQKKKEPSHSRRAPFLLSDADPRLRALDDLITIYQTGEKDPKKLNRKSCDHFDAMQPHIVAALAEGAGHLFFRVTQRHNAACRQREEARAVAVRKVAADADRAAVMAEIRASNLPTDLIVFGSVHAWPPESGTNFVAHGATGENWDAMLHAAELASHLDDLGHRGGHNAKDRIVNFARWIRSMERMFQGATTAKATLWIWGRFIVALEEHHKQGKEGPLNCAIPMRCPK